jgi:hypothetical protein
MNWEPNAESQEFVRNTEKVSILRGEKVSLEEARKRLLDKTMNVVLWRPEDIPWLEGSPKREEYLEPFNTEVWQSYKSALDFLLNSEELHKIALDKKIIDITENQVREILMIHNAVKPDLLDEVSHRINLFLHHSLDVEVVKLRVKMLLDKVPSDGEVLFKEEEKRRLFEIFDGDHRIQELWVNVMARNIWHNSNFECDEKDIKRIEVLIERWVRLSKYEDSASVGKKLRALFVNIAGIPTGTMTINRINDVDMSLKLVGTKLSSVEDEERYLEDELSFGSRDFLEKRARKTELVRFLCKLEDVQDQVLDIKLPKPEYYTIGKKGSDGQSSNSVIASIRVINWNIPDHIDVDSTGAWIDKYFNTRFKAADINFKDK